MNSSEPNRDKRSAKREPQQPSAGADQRKKLDNKYNLHDFIIKIYFNYLFIAFKNLLIYKKKIQK